ncbi:hypothetical protein IT82_00930 [Listeria monocytogenes]|uniref:hypothetical protein n=1 Tax=Listeria monocytogenes TaxID=1639 RepID=UPI0010B3D5BE|nr:hypothetical protein [Listeria monocytogenes]EAC8324406.1 hypothetical protein [Listeria monocytogenes]EAC8327498.1 hypothetical protein [Listeria monocytogenes]EAC8637159.1 hypothetical protein [Listeria monocytogenes]ECB9822275.1 hypothetical protein [Listeria monocytogenes]ELA3157196.1 hypothetical protein [Listeria monocytogenes]
MEYQILKKSNVVELKNFYNNIQNKFQVEAKIPDQIFLDPNEVYVFDLWDFLDENVQYLLDFTKKANGDKVLWLPKYNNIYANEYMYINARMNKINFRQLWDNNKLTIFLEQGCMFDISGDWISYFDLEEHLAILAVYSCDISLNDFSKAPYTKENFLEEYLMVPIEKIDKSTKNLMKNYNEKFVDVFLENYF